MTDAPLPFNLLTILGPTASGKTRLAVALAGELNGEIISADSRQVFRGMDIGSGKDLHEYGAIPCHLIDILDAGQEFSVFAFQRLFIAAFEEIAARNRLPLLCGGSGMYLDAALRGYRLVEVSEDAGLRAELAARSDAELAAMLREIASGAAQHHRPVGPAAHHPRHRDRPPRAKPGNGSGAVPPHTAPGDRHTLGAGRVAAQDHGAPQTEAGERHDRGGATAPRQGGSPGNGSTTTDWSTATWGPFCGES